MTHVPVKCRIGACAPRKLRQLTHHDQRLLPARVPVLADLRGSHPLEWTCPGIPGSGRSEDLISERRCLSGVFCLQRRVPRSLLDEGPQATRECGRSHGGAVGAVNLSAGSGTDACASGVHNGCIAARVPHRHTFINPHKTPSNAHEICFGYTPSEFVGRVRRHAVAPVL